jgi:predicted transcriptional regulator
MDDVLPQEIEVRYIIPAIRGRLAHVLVEEKGVSQKQAAKLLGLTEAAISQYINGKRGNEVIFSEGVVDEIRRSADSILADKANRGKMVAELYRISHLTNVKQILCDMHRKQSKGLEECTICFDDKELVQIRNVK